MKTIIATIAALAALTGCAVPQPGYYAAAPRVQDPYQWHTVAVMPAGSTAQSGTWTEAAPAQPVAQTYSTQPAYATTYVSQPVYYDAAPVYYAPAPAYYYPPVTVGLDFSFGHWCCGGGWGRGGWGRGGYRHR